MKNNEKFLQFAIDKRKECSKDIEKTNMILSMLEKEISRKVISKTVDSKGETKIFYMQMMSTISTVDALLKSYLDSANGYMGVLEGILTGTVEEEGIDEKLRPFVEGIRSTMSQMQEICKSVEKRIKKAKEKKLKIDYPLFNIFLKQI